VILLCVGVSGTVRGALAELSRYQWQVRPLWLIAAALLYAAGLVPMAWFWHRALAALGQPAPWPATLRAYYLGHIGKYVPGKAMAVVLRVAGVRKWVSIRNALVSSLLETLTMMAVGAFLAAVLSTFVLRMEPSLAAIALAMAAVAGLPTLPPVARRLARIGLQRVKPNGEAETPATSSIDLRASLDRIDLHLLAGGWFAAILCWTLLGVSLWATLTAIGVDKLSPLSDLPRLMAAVAFAVVAGFLSLLPGGLLVRDALLMQLLAPVCGKADALVAAVLLRLVWLVTELAVCGILYVAARTWEHEARS
jgi:glycosyltransferase 2 family protein